MSRSEPSLSGADLEWADIAAMLKGQRWVIASIAALTTIVAVFYAFLAPEMYRAVVVLRPADSDSMGAGALVGQLSGLASIAGVSLPGASAANDGFVVINSAAMAERFVELKQLEPLLRRRAGDAPSVRKAVRRFKEEFLDVREDRRNNLITVAVVWDDPSVAAEWANELVELTNEQLRARDKQDAERNLAYLKSELEETSVVEMQRVLFQLIEKETQTLMLVDAREEYALKVLDRAYAPEWRDSPKRAQVILIGLVAGLVLGVIVAVVHVARSQITR